MAVLFGRAWRVQVGTLALGQLDVEFKVKRTLRARAGTCELIVYNLSEAHRAELRGLRRALVQIEAGYTDALAMLFRGDSRKVTVVREGTDWTCTVTGGDGEHALQTARVSRSFSAGARVEEVVGACADALGIGRGNLPEALQGAELGRVGATFAEGTVVHGSAAAELARVLASAGFEWSIQDGVLQLLPVGRALQRTAVVLSPDTGLVGSPEVGKSRTVKAVGLIQPDLMPGRLVDLRSAVVTGLYRVEEVEFTGNTRGEEWYANLTLKERPQ